MKYDDTDFEKVVKKETTINEMLIKYNVNKKTFIKALNRRGYYLNKTKIKITSPFKTKIIYSYSACANELGVSERTIRNYLGGKRVKIFEEMNIKIEVIKR